MWNVGELPGGNWAVAGNLIPGLSLLFVRAGGAPVIASVVSDENEPRLFDKSRMPMLIVDGSHVIDLGVWLTMSPLILSPGKVVVAEDRCMGSRIWHGEGQPDKGDVLALMTGQLLRVRVFFANAEMLETEVTLDGFRAAFEEAFVAHPVPASMAPPVSVAPHQAAISARQSHGPSLSQAIAGEVVQTAVRATVWNLIGALFRGFR